MIHTHIHTLLQFIELITTIDQVTFLIATTLTIIITITATTITGDINTNMSTQAFVVSNIVWDYLPTATKTINIVPDVKHAPSTVSIPWDELSVHELPDVDMFTYEAERDWMIQEYLLENYKLLAEEFVVVTI